MKILYEDNHLLVVEKEENRPSQKDESNDLDVHSLAKEYLRTAYNKTGNIYLGLLHRLDRRVGGVMMFAKTSKAASRISEEIRNRGVIKKYRAIVDGTLLQGDTWIDWMEKSSIRAVASTKNCKNAVEAILSFIVLSHFTIEDRPYTLVEVELITGRYNQIRFQFANRGYPIVEDFKYGYKGPNLFNQLGLWCHYIEITHPITKNKIHFISLPAHGIWKYVDKKEELSDR